MLICVISCSTLHSFVTQKNYEAWKKNIDDLNQPSIKYVKNAPTTIWENFILIEGSMHYAFTRKEAEAALGNKIAGIKQYVGNPADFQSFLKGFLGYVQWLVTEHTELATKKFNADLVKGAQERIANIESFHTRTQKIKDRLDQSEPALFQNEPLNVQAVAKSLMSVAADGLTSVNGLETLLSKNKNNKHLELNIRKEDFNAAFEREFFQNAFEQAESILEIATTIEKISRIMTETYNETVTAGDFKAFIQGMFGYDRLSKQVYSVNDIENVNEQFKKKREDLIETYRAGQKTLLEDLKTRIQVSARTAKKSPAPIAYQDELSKTNEERQPEFLFKQLIKSLESINLTDAEQYSHSMHNFENLSFDYARIGLDDLKRLCDNILKILMSLEKPTQQMHRI